MVGLACPVAQINVINRQVSVIVLILTIRDVVEQSAGGMLHLQSAVISAV